MPLTGPRAEDTDIQMLADALRRIRRLEQRPIGAASTPFAWTDRVGIYLQSNPDASVTGTSAHAWVVAAFAADSVSSTSHKDNDFFTWDSSSPADLLIKQDGFYHFSSSGAFTPDSGALMEFYASMAPGGTFPPLARGFPDSNPAAYIPLAATDPMDWLVHHTYIIEGGTTITHYVDAYNGPATGAVAQINLAVFKITP